MNNKIVRNSMKFKWVRLLYLLLLLGWMTLIYIKSSEPYRDQDMRPLLADWIPQSALNQWLPKLEFSYSGQWLSWTEPYVLLEFIVRKCAHIAEFAILTFLCLLNVQASPLKRFNYWLSPLFALGYAASDEWHQSFVVGRTGHAIDVGMDAVGILIVMIIWLIWSMSKINKRKIKNLSGTTRR